MSFTYTAQPATRYLDAIRLEIGDTQSNQHEIEDEEIEYAYAREGTVVQAAARCCEMLAAKYAKKDGFRGGTIQTEKTTVSGKYRTMARYLRARGVTAGSFIMPSMSKDRKADNAADTDTVQPFFKRGIMNNPDVDDDSDSDQNLSVTGNT